jgi:16S rRNA (guanine527-N7)-methyltransferase
VSARDRLLAVHRELLERFRQAMNLVGPGPVDQHYVDARLALEGLAPRGRWADLGTGAGFPGVVLAADWPDVAVDLVDSRRKRCTFLEEVLDRAGVDGGVRVVCARIEDLPGRAYDGVTARALAPPAEALALAAPKVVDGGRAVLLLQDDQDAPDVPGWARVEERAYRLPDGRPRRRVVWRRTG